MKITKPHYYDDFHCIAGDCPDTCCANWEVVIDPESKAFYESVPGELGARLREAMLELDGETCFGLRNGLCVLLRPDGLCPIQAELGEEHLCRICGTYPRFSTEIGLRREIGISLSCPEAARLILTGDTPLRLHRETTDEPMTSFHELPAELIVGMDRLRDAALKIAQDRAIPFPLRCAAVIRLCEPVQKTMRRPGRMGAALSEGIQNAAEAAAPAQIGGLEHFRAALSGALAPVEALRPEWKARLSRAAKAPLEKTDWEALCPEYPSLWEQLLCYGIYKYFPRAVFDRNIHSAAVFAVTLPLLLRQLLREDNDVLRLAWSLSRELEHSEDNMKLLWDAFSRRPFRPDAVAAVFAAL